MLKLVQGLCRWLIDGVRLILDKKQGFPLKKFNFNGSVIDIDINCIDYFKYKCYRKLNYIF